MTSKTIHAGQTLSLTQGVTFGGSAVIDGGGVAGGTVRVVNSATLTASARVQVLGGAGVMPHQLAGAGGTLAVSGVLLNDGAVSVVGGAAGLYKNFHQGLGGSGGLLSDSGTLTNYGGIALLAGAPSAAGYEGGGGRLMVSGVLTNAGTLSAAGASPFGFIPGVVPAAMIASSGTIDNGATGLIEVGFGEQAATLASAGTLSNAGTVSLLAGPGIDKADGYPPYGAPTEGGVLQNTGALTNTGLIMVAGGLAGQDYYGAGGGRGGDLSNAGVLTNNGLIVLAGGAAGVPGYRDGGFGGALVAGGTVTNNGTVLLDGGGASTGGAFEGGSGGYLHVTGNFYNNGMIGVDSGALGGSAGGGGFLRVDGSLIDAGTIVVQQSGAYGAGGSVYVGQHGQLTLGSFNKGGVLSVTGSAGGFAAIYNSGLIFGTGSITASAIANAGTIEVTNRTLTVNAAVTGTGVLYANYLGTLSLTGVVAATQTLVISGSGVVRTGVANAGLAVRSQAGAQLVLTGGGNAVLNAADTRLAVTLAQAGSLTLSAAGFVSGTGSAGADHITADAAGQTLSGGAGADVLSGAAAFGDTFMDTAAGLNGDTIIGFGGSDVIDVTDLAPGAGLSLDYAQGAGQGVLTLSEGGRVAAITLVGSFSQGQFSTSADMHGGVLVHVGG